MDSGSGRLRRLPCLHNYVAYFMRIRNSKLHNPCFSVVAQFLAVNEITSRGVEYPNSKLALCDCNCDLQDKIETLSIQPRKPDFGPVRPRLVWSHYIYCTYARVN